MLKEYLPKYYLNMQYNSSEALIRAANEYYGLSISEYDMGLFGGFADGLQTGNTCGAVIACTAILSMMYINKRGRYSEDIKPVMEIFMRIFNEEFGSTMCSDLKPLYYTKNRHCYEVVEAAADILQKAVAEYEDEEFIDPYF